MNSSGAQIGDWLGVRPPGDESQVLRLVEGGLAPAVVGRLLALGLTRSEVGAVVIAARTLQHRRSRREKLSTEESDHVLRVVRALSLAAAVYGSRERALAWMRRSHPRLDGRTPLSLLKTDTGSRMVEELLAQIDDGIFV